MVLQMMMMRLDVLPLLCGCRIVCYFDVVGVVNMHRDWCGAVEVRDESSEFVYAEQFLEFMRRSQILCFACR